MTSVLTTSVADPAALRSVFAAPDETLVLAIVDSNKDQGLRTAIEAVEKLKRDGAKLRLLVYGDSSAIIPEVKDSAAGSIGFLESWARPLLPAALNACDVVIALGEQSDSLLDEHRDPSTRMAVILRENLDVESLRATLAELRSSRGAGRSIPVPNPPRQAKGLAQYVLQNDWGMGDELLLSAVAREIIRAHPGTEIWIRSRFGFRFPKYVRRDPPPQEVRSVETIYQNPTLYGPNAHSPFPGHLVQQMLDKFALDTGLKVKALDLRPELEIPPPEHRMDPSVILHSRPNPRLSSKDWGLRRWEKLAELLHAGGVRVRQVGGREEPLLPKAEDLRGLPANELPGIFVQSSAVVCVVGLLMHLAEAARTPAVVIYGGREHPAIDGYPDQVHLSSQPLPCRGRWGCHLGPDLDCPHGMKCMEHISPELVAREVLSMLGRGGLR
jgi:hypothetical protein